MKSEFKVSPAAAAGELGVMPQSTPPYSLVSSTGALGTSLCGKVRLPPAALVRCFGLPPSRGDGHKISGEYVFSDGNLRFTLYDWKCTALAADADDPERSLAPSPEAFWSSEEPVEFNIGGIAGGKGVGAFKNWLIEQTRVA